MATPINLPSTLCGHSTLHCLVIGMICTATILVTTPMESALAQDLSAHKPASTAEGNVRAGKIIFGRHCVTCHGPRGRGDGLAIAKATVADLSSPTTQRKLNVDLLATIHEGRPGKVMPSWGYRLSKEQSRDVLAYVRTLRRK